MLLYDKAYMEIKNKYIVPLSKYSVSYRNIKYTNIKEMLYNKFISVEKIGKQEYIFRFEKDDILKGLLGDIHLFYIRHVIQSQDSKESTNCGLSANWNIVTNYYKAYFASALLLRLCFRGNLFIDEINKRKLEKLVSCTIGEAISLESNQFFEIINIDDEFVLKTTKAINNTHELVWKKMDLLLEDFILLSRDKSDERAFLTMLKQINNELGNTYPSKLRNKVNYQPLYGKKYIDNELLPLNIEQNWVSSVFKYDTSILDENRTVNLMNAYYEYIHHFCDNLIAEYYEIKGNENGVIKHCNKKYNGAILLPKKQFVFER